MTWKDIEEYRFYRLYSIDLESAKQTLSMIARYRRKDIRYAILRDFIVVYGRPFSGNRGRVWHSHRLREAIVPAEHRALHGELLALRNRAFAHTDHDYFDPRIAQWPSKSGRKAYPMSFKVPPYADLERRFKAMTILVAAVEAAVNAWVEAFHVRLDAL
jgi:hypothetical protein